MTVCHRAMARRLVWLLLIVVAMPLVPQGHAAYNIMPTVSNTSGHGYQQHCGSDMGASVSRHQAGTMTDHADCDDTNQACQCLSAACSTPLALVAQVEIPMVAPIADAHFEATVFAILRRSYVLFRPPIAG